MQGEKVKCPKCGGLLCYIAPDKTTKEYPEVGFFVK
jgi:hypothetical protein